ncbi:MAG TPA: hypothetical protein PK644_03960, partial [bacterium]|nr:hypothetical protein [bacterium]
MKKFLVVGLLLLFWSGQARSQKLSFPGSRISPEVITPHTAWAKPWHSGSIRILALSAAASTREIVELSQRMEADITCVPVPEVKKELPEVWSYLREKLKEPYELILAGSLRWSDLPEDIRQTVLEKV